MGHYWLRPLSDEHKITQVFGANPAMYKADGFPGHMGIDFGCLLNTPVQSAFWGEIIEIGWSKTGYGGYVKIRYGDYIVLYGHLNIISVVQGCYVTRGQIIGRSGNTGKSTGPHLHFEVQDPANMNTPMHGRIDPLPFFSDMPSNTDPLIKKIEAEIAQIKKDGYTKDSMFIHTKYIEKILSNKL